MRIYIFSVLQVVVLIQYTCSYQLIKVDPGIVSVSPGESVSLLCGVDAHWEYCKFSGPNFQECDFEWKRLANGVRMQQCNVNDRAQFHGKYDDKECGMVLKNVQPSDSGIWSCGMEEYVFLGTKGSGRMAVGQINITVQATTTERSVTSPSETIYNEQSTLDITEEVQQTTEKKEITTKLVETSTSLVDDATEVSTEKKEMSNSILVNPNTKFSQDASEDSSEEAPEAVPRIEEANSNLSAVIGVICAVALIGVIGVAAMAFRKRQLARQRPDAAAAVVYDRESRSVNDERTMVGGQQLTATVNSQQQQQARKPDSNYHEFFPPNLTGQNAATTTYNSV